MASRKKFGLSAILIAGSLLLSVSALSPWAIYADESKKETGAQAESSANQTAKTESAAAEHAGKDHSEGALTGEGALKGGVEQVEISLTRMRDVSLDVKTLESDVKGLYGEATRQIVSIESSPNIIGGVLVNIPYRFETGSYLPPRRKQVKHYVSQIGPTLKLLKEGVEEMECGCRAILVPEGIRDEFQPIVKDWNALVKEANEHFDDLEKYVAENRLTNSELGGRAQELSNDMRGLEATLKQAFKLVKRAQKKNKNDKLVPIA